MFLAGTDLGALFKDDAGLNQSDSASELPGKLNFFERWVIYQPSEKNRENLAKYSIHSESPPLVSLISLGVGRGSAIGGGG